MRRGNSLPGRSSSAIDVPLIVTICYEDDSRHRISSSHPRSALISMQCSNEERAQVQRSVTIDIKGEEYLIVGLDQADVCAQP